LLTGGLYALQFDLLKDLETGDPESASGRCWIVRQKSLRPTI